MDQYEAHILSEAMAKEICTWRYDGKYSVYNFSSWDLVVANRWDLSIKAKREKEFIGYTVNEALIAFGRIHKENQIVFLGIGLKPAYCGMGLGKDLTMLLIKEAKIRYPNLTIALEVRSFNIRALKCYQKLGFVEKKRYMKYTLNGITEFIYMEMKG